MTTAGKGGENEADTYSIDGAWTAGNLSKAKQHQRGPGSTLMQSCLVARLTNIYVSGTHFTVHGHQQLSLETPFLNTWLLLTMMGVHS